MFRLIIFTFIYISIISFADASVDLKFGIGFDRGVVEDGSRSKAENYGYSIDGHLLFSVLEPLYLGVFGFKDWSETHKIYKGNNIDNFHISPQGYGAELGLRFYSVMVKVGIGRYSAVARRVEDSIGRDYELTDGEGYHFGLEKRFSITRSINWFIGGYTRHITYSKVKIKGTELTPVDLPNDWEQNVYSVIVGFAINLFYLDKNSSAASTKQAPQQRNPQ